MKKVFNALIALTLLGYGSMAMATTVCWFKPEKGVHCCKHVPGEIKCFVPAIPEPGTDVPPPPTE